MIIENPLFTQDVPEKGATRGHIIFGLASRTPEDIALVGFCANITASLLFERLQAQGTNIIMDLGKDSSSIHVLARSENDGLNLLWQPKPIDPSQLNDIQERIRNKTFFIGKESKSSPKEPESAKSVPANAPVHDIHKSGTTDEHEDYLVKQLHRIP